MRLQRKTSREGRRAFLNLLQDEKALRLTSYENRVKRDKAKATNISKKKNKQRLATAL